ncbi:MAG: T9SS type A sorting domain-containing protein [Bacteroidetes bacterium]|nr:T9SS type A sorting domain-containing protein [Bacteroidota bacterium]MBL6943449.1 T9SS type A sorting domain-containing protein [Bacteroidales bacterium]
MKKTFISLLLSIFITSVSIAQLITADPAFPTENDQVVITFNSSLGSGGLAGFTGDMYAHTGVITSNSSSGSDWKYVKAGWTENIPECKLTMVGDDLWELTIGPSVRDYYGVPTNETILQMAFVFRSADGSLVGKTETGGDIFYDVYASGLNILITIPEQRPYIVELNDNILVEGNSIGADSTFIFLDGDMIYADTGSTFSTNITATDYGKHWVVATATDENDTVIDSIYYYVRQEPVVEELPPGIAEGINYTGAESATLCLVAPEKEFIFVIGDFNDWEIDDEYEMKITPDGQRFWLELSNLEQVKEYVFQYFIDGSVKVGDPYSEKVSDPWNDKWISNTTYPDLIEYPTGKTNGIATVIQTSQVPYQWQINDFQNPDVTDMVIYELLVRDFIATHDFATLIDTLDYLERLGINVIELMPNSEFEGNSSWGYNPNYYFAPDKYYGPKNTLKAFVDECHERGIAVFMDLVLNHAYGTNALAMMYWNGELNRPAANNPWFNEQSNFLNPDAQWGNDFNHESLYTQQFVDSINSYWINEYNIDGFRFDFTKGIGNNIKGNGDPWGSKYDADRIALLKRMADKIWEQKSDATIIFEHLAENSEEKELANYGILMWGNLNHNYNEATMGYNSGGQSDFSWISYKKRGWNNPHVVGYMESHDEERLMFKNLEYGASSGDYSVKDLATALKRQELAANFFFTIPGPKMIWQFGERGYDVSIEYNGRLGEKPPRWDYLEDWRRRNLMYIYSALIDLKKNEDAFSTTDFSLDLYYALKKIKLNSTDMSVVVLGNFGIEEGDINPDFHFTGTWYNYWTGDSIEVANVSETIPLQAGEYKLFTSKKLSKPELVGISDIGSTQNINILYPNPVFNALTITNTEDVEQINIYNLLGVVVYSELGNRSIHTNINTQDFKPGYYFVQLISNSGKSVTKKFIKK